MRRYTANMAVKRTSLTVALRGTKPLIFYFVFSCPTHFYSGAVAV